MIKYKFVKKSKEADIKDRIISKKGHEVFFTLNNMEDNEKSLTRDKEKIEETLKVIETIDIAKESSKFTPEQNNAIVMYRGAEKDAARLTKMLTEDISDKEKVELTSTIANREAIMSNVLHFNPFIQDVTGEQADLIEEEVAAGLAIKAYRDKLEEINSILAESKLEKAEIYKQLEI